jgi:hypothetical protein
MNGTILVYEDTGADAYVLAAIGVERRMSPAVIATPVGFTSRSRRVRTRGVWMVLCSIQEGHLMELLEKAPGFVR